MKHRAFCKRLFMFAVSSLVLTLSAQAQAQGSLQVPELGMSMQLPAGFTMQQQPGKSGSIIYRVSYAANADFTMAISTMPARSGLGAEQVLQGIVASLSAGIKQSSGQAPKGQRADTTIDGQDMYGFAMPNIPTAKGKTSNMIVYTAQRQGHYLNITIVLPKLDAKAYAPISAMLDSIHFSASQQGAQLAPQQAPAHQAAGSGPVLQIDDMGLRAPFSGDWQQQKTTYPGMFNFVNAATGCLLTIQVYMGAKDLQTRRDMTIKMLQQQSAKFPDANHGMKNLNIGGSSVPGYVVDNIKVPTMGGAAHMEKYFISNGDFSATVSFVAPQAKLAAARKAFVAWTRGLHMQQIAVSPPKPAIQNNLLVGTYSKGGSISGSTVSASSMDFDGRGHLSYSTSMYMYKIGIANSSHEGSYSVKGDSVTLEYSSVRDNCIVSQRNQDGGIKQLNCGGTTWTK